MPLLPGHSLTFAAFVAEHDRDAFIVGIGEAGQIWLRKVRSFSLVLLCFAIFN